MQCKPDLFFCNFIKNILTAEYPSRLVLIRHNVDHVGAVFDEVVMHLIFLYMSPSYSHAQQCQNILKCLCLAVSYLKMFFLIEPLDLLISALFVTISCALFCISKFYLTSEAWGKGRMAILTAGA